MIKPDGSPVPAKTPPSCCQSRKWASTLIADNPGIWMMHCHNTYHQEAGMMTSLNYAMVSFGRCELEGVERAADFEAHPP